MTRPRANTTKSSDRLRLVLSAAVGRSFVPMLRRQIPRAHRLLPSSLEELSIALVGNSKMAELHERFLGVAGPTDVLTFPLEQDARGRCTSGEVVVCVPVARRQAKQRGIRAENEVLLYAIHGMLHLSGLDDRTDADYRTMHRTEDRILTELGVGATFDIETGASPRQPQRRRPSMTKRATARGR